MSLRDFEVLDKLGEGAYSTVFRVRRRSDNQLYALKKVKLHGLKDKEKANALNEVRILASIRHPNVIAYKEAFVDQGTNTLCIIMEFADGGDLLQQIMSNKKRGTLLPENRLWPLFIQMMQGLKALHDMQVLHRDLKCANVFLFKDGTAKLGDMNVSKVAKAGLVYTQTGTPYYASPEVWKDQPYDSKSDIWSLGCVMYEAITLHPPFQANDMQGLFKKVIRGAYPELPSVYSADLKSLVRSLLQVTPSMRPTCGSFYSERLLSLPVVLRNTPTSPQLDSQQGSLLGTIVLPRNMSAISDRLPAPNYERVERKVPESAKHEKPPLPAALPTRSNLAARGRDLIQQHAASKESRVLSAIQEEKRNTPRNFSSDARTPGVQHLPTYLPPLSKPQAGPVVVVHGPQQSTKPQHLAPLREIPRQPVAGYRPPSNSSVRPSWWG